MPDDSESWKGDSRGSHLRGPLKAPALPQEGHLRHFTLIHPPTCHRMTIGAMRRKETNQGANTNLTSGLAQALTAAVAGIPSGQQGPHGKTGPQDSSIGRYCGPSGGGSWEAPTLRPREAYLSRELLLGTLLPL